MVSPKIHKINPENPDTEVIEDAAAVIRKGGVIAFPTRSLYGLGADAFNSDAVNRIFKIKQRPAKKPILILIDDANRLKSLVTHISEAAKAISERFWPGRVTLVFDASAKVPRIILRFTSGPNPASRVSDMTSSTDALPSSPTRRP